MNNGLTTFPEQNKNSLSNPLHRIKEVSLSRWQTRRRTTPFDNAAERHIDKLTFGK